MGEPGDVTKRAADGMAMGCGVAVLPAIILGIAVFVMP